MKNYLTKILLSAVLIIAAGVNLKVEAQANGFIYTNNDDLSGNSVSAYSINNDGTLTQVSGSPFSTGGNGNGGGYFGVGRLSTAKVGNFLYASNSGSSSISGFNINPSTGALTLISGFPVSTGQSAGNGMGLLVSPNGGYLFCGNDGSSNISVYTINFDGTLTQIGGSPFSVGNFGGVDGMAISPDGTLLAACNPNSPDISQFTISNGALTPVAGSPFYVGGSVSYSASVVYNSSSTILYSGQTEYSGNSQIQAFTAGTFNNIAGSPFPFNDGFGGAQALAISSDDQYLYASNPQGVTVSSYYIGGGGCSEVSGSPFSASNGNFYIGDLTINSDNSKIYVASSFFTNKIVGFNSAAGVLTPITGSPFNTDDGNGTMLSLTFFSAPLPTITSFAATSGCVGDLVDITGTNFNLVTSVLFNGVAATFTINNANDITATVPAGATTGMITVCINSNCANTSLLNPSVFTINGPNITSCPGNVNQANDAGLCGATITYPPATTDNINDVITYSQNSGTFFPVGTTTVLVTASNNCGNSTCSFTITITDNEPPTLSGCSSDISVNNDLNMCSAVVTFNDPTATDNCSTTQSGSFTFGYTGSEQSWTVPAGVTSVTIDMAGAAGGNGLSGGDLGGAGGRVQGTLTVSGGQVLNIFVGQKGPNQSYTTVGAGAFNGGGGGWQYYGGGGGGGTDIRIGGTALSNRVVVAGGGGGGGYYCGDDNGGPGGAPDQASGSGFWCGGNANTFVGYGGDQVSGGTSADCNAGSLGQGGAGCYFYGGTGGGGYYGGGSGYYGGGGGGSNYVGGLNITTNNAQGFETGAGYVMVNYSLSYPVVTLTSGLPSGSAFPVGTTQECYTAVDGAGNTAQCCFNVVVNDTQAPTVSCPGDQTRNADQTCTYTVAGTEFDATFTDNCSASSSFSLSGATFGNGNNTLNGVVFFMGTTTVTWTVTDSTGNTATCSFNVTVVDAPTITCPADISNYPVDQGLCTASNVPIGTASAVDNCGANIVSVTSNAPNTFPLGNTVVIWTAVNDIGNSSTCSQNIMVIDNQPPVFTSCSDVSVNNDPGLCSAVVTWDNPTATDNCGGIVLVNTVVSFSYTGGQETWVVPSGVTSITYDVAGAQGGNQLFGEPGGNGGRETGVSNVTPGNTLYINVGGQGGVGSGVYYIQSSGGFDGGGMGSEYGGGGGGYTAINTTSFNLNNAIGVAGGGGGAGYGCGFGDNGGPGGALTGGAGFYCGSQGGFYTGGGGTQVAGGTGSTVYGCGSGNGSFSQGGNGCPWYYGDYYAGGGGGGWFGGGAGGYGGGGGGSNWPNPFSTNVVEYQGTQSGNGYAVISYQLPVNSPYVVQISGPSSGSTYPVGNTLECFLATDASGNTSECCFNIVVTDNEAPVITCPGDQTRNVDQNQCTYTAVGTEFDATFTDNCSVTAINDYNGNSTLAGAVFNIGGTLVTWTATDNSGNTSSCSFNITVLDAPTVICPSDITTNADQGQCSAVINDIGTATGFDCDNGPVTFTNNGSSPYSVGTTVVIWTATNDQGNTSTCAQNIVVIDNQPPVFNCPGDISVNADQGLCRTGIRICTYS